jgi:protein-S-isoprenylcysteine O-methyltransferase Ste14
MNKTVDHAQVVVNPFVICAGTLVGAVLLQQLLPLRFLPPTMARIVGGGVFVLGFVFGLPASRFMRQAKTTLNPGRSTTMLVTSGPFSLSRNPIYVALLLNYTGLAIFFGTLWGLLLLPAVVWMMNRWVIIPEEHYLEQKFGAAYTRYRASVRRWM